MQQEVKIIFAAGKVFRKLRSGMTTVYCEALTMKLYCTRDGRKDNNVDEVFSISFR